MSLHVGLTGNIGSGKSSVARLLEARGAAVIDADALARQATEDAEVLAAIARDLGAELVAAGRLDRAATARRVFGDPEARRRLNAIVHPWVRRATERLTEALERAPEPPAVIVHDVPLLYENGLDRGLDAVIVVDAPLAERVARVAARSRLSEEDVRSRDAAQMPLDDKVARADYVVDNGGTLEELEARVDAVWRALLERAATRR
ncbi:MAG: dephospho-CoA kinase [Deinococcales bacterium]